MLYRFGSNKWGLFSCKKSKSKGKRRSKRSKRSKRSFGRKRRRSFGSRRRLSRQRLSSRRFGAFGGGRASTLLGMEGPYMSM